MTSPHVLSYKMIRKQGLFAIAKVDTRKSFYRGIPWHSLGSFGKRKFENLVALSQKGQIVRVIYD